MWITGFILTAVSVFCVLLASNLPTVQAVSEYAILEARPAEAKEAESKLSVCIVFNNQHQSLPSVASKEHFHRLVNLSHLQGCSPKDFTDSPVSLENSVVAVARGSCTFIQKAFIVQSFNASAVLVVDYPNKSFPTYPGGNTSDFKSLTIILATIAFEEFKAVLSLSKSVDVSLYVPANPLWDANMILIIILSTILVMAGAAWSAYDVWQFPKRSRRKPLKSRDSEDSDEDAKAQKNENEITVFTTVIWFILICAMILLLYFFYDYMVYFFIAVFCISGTYSLYHCLLPLWSWFLPVIYDIPVDKLPCVNSKVKLRSFLLLLLCNTVGIFWAIQRHSRYAWIFQDLLGAAFCIFFMHTLRLPNLKVIAILLILLLIYDVFFVFITPHFTNDGNSIMESVATGGKGHSKESLPMVFLLPTLSDFPLRRCMDREFSLLGFGDVIIPGLLVSYNAVFDVKTGNKMVYFITSSLGYFFGMIICIVSLIYMNSGQPALLYLVPGTLFTTVVVALIRKEFNSLFFGLHKQKSERAEPVESQGRDSEEGDAVNDCTDEEENNLIK